MVKNQRFLVRFLAPPMPIEGAADRRGLFMNGEIDSAYGNQYQYTGRFVARDSY